MHEFHLTLHFLGALTVPAHEACVSVLNGLRTPALDLEMCGLGTFPETGPPRVLFAEVVLTASLRELHRELQTAFASECGYQPEARPYHPHVTLAHFQTSEAGAVFAQTWKERSTEFRLTFRATDLAFLRSDFLEGSPCYREEVVISLT